MFPQTDSHTQSSVVRERVCHECACTQLSVHTCKQETDKKNSNERIIIQSINEKFPLEEQEN